MAASWTNFGFTEYDYFHESVTGEHRGTPPLADGRALDRWEADRARHVAKCNADWIARHRTDGQQ